MSCHFVFFAEELAEGKILPLAVAPFIVRELDFGPGHDKQGEIGNLLHQLVRQIAYAAAHESVNRSCFIPSLERF